MKLDSDVQRKLYDAIDSRRNVTVDFLKKLVQTPSVTGSEGKCAQVCYDKIKQIGLEADMWELNVDEMRKHPAYNDVIKLPPLDYPLSYAGRPNVVGVYRGGGEGRSLILNGHMDTVSPDPLSKWTRDPWGGEVEGNRLYGRGACDQKCGIAAMVVSMQTILEQGLRPHGDVMLECVIEEEVAVGNGTLGCILRGYRADASIITEPTDLVICNSARAGLYWRITIEGKSSHGVEKWEGVDAIQLGTKVLDSLRYLEASLSTTESHPIFNGKPILVPVTPDKIRAGVWKGMVAPECVIEGYFEPLPGKPLREWETIFTNYVANAMKYDPWLRDHPPKVQFKERYDAYVQDMNDPFLQVMKEAYRGATGNEPVVEGSNGGCEAWMHATHGGSSTLELGPSGAHAHGADEWANIDDLIKVQKVYASTILEWCGYDSS